MAAFLTWVLLATVLSALCVRLFLAQRDFRRLELAIPGLPSLPLLGNVLDVAKVGMWSGGGLEGTTRGLLSLWGGHTGLFRGSLLGRLFVAVSQPDDVEAVLRGKQTQGKARHFYRFFEDCSGEGLVTLNGSKWRAHRRALQPAFHAEVLERHLSVVAEECAAFARRVSPGAEQRVGPNLRRALGGIFVRTALATDMGMEEERGVDDFLRFLAAFGEAVHARSVYPWLWPDTLFALTATARRLRRLKKTVGGFADRVIRARRAELQRDKAQQHDNKDFIQQRATLIDVLLESEELSDAEILAEVKTFLGAAIDSTVVTLGWVLKVLSVRPDVQERVLQEVETVVGLDDKIGTHHLTRLEYTECVIKETMRLLPTTPLLARSNPDRTEILGYTVPAETVFVVNVYGLHRDPRHWAEPTVFDPDRFNAERSAGRHPYAFLPFSAGPRSCIGERYAMMTMKTFLATLLPRYRVEAAADGLTDPAAFPYVFVLLSRMPGGVRVKLTPRRIEA